MANRSDSKLRFTIEESVWLRNGQEVAEVLSMSLNPEISIDDYGEQILIKGYLYLTGEYKPRVSEEHENRLEEQSLKDQLQFRSMEQINETAEGVLELEHRFPVDITIPKQRIADVSELYVNIESFDYDLPSSNCIELTADVAITGISKENEASNVERMSENEASNVERMSENDAIEVYTSEEDEEPVDSSPRQNTFKEFEFEARKAPEPEEEDDDPEDNIFTRENDENVINSNQTSPIVEMKSREQDRDYKYSGDDSEKYDYGDSYLSPLKSLSSYQDEEEDVEEEDIEEEQTTVYTQYDYNANDRVNQAQMDENEKTEEAEEVETSNANERPHREENALYLTSILNREEEEFSKLKMCIVQPGESLDTVAARYEVSPSHLVRVNHLDNDEVSEGQILYIPIPAGRV